MKTKAKHSFFRRAAIALLTVLMAFAGAQTARAQEVGDITINESTNGSITVTDGTMAITSGTHTYSVRATITVTAMPSIGYRLSQVTVERRVSMWGAWFPSRAAPPTPRPRGWTSSASSRPRSSMRTATRSTTSTWAKTTDSTGLPPFNTNWDK